MELLLTKLQDSDAEKLYAFEMENRLFFEEMVPSRGEDYYQVETFMIRHQALLAEQREKRSEFNLIRDNLGNIVGRINLVDIDPINHVAEVGFRVGKAYVGKGIGTAAVNLLLNKAVHIKKIKAKTTTNNIASQKTLERNGFKQIYVSDDPFEMNGQQLKFIHYIWER